MRISSSMLAALVLGMGMAVETANIRQGERDTKRVQPVLDKEEQISKAEKKRQRKAAAQLRNKHGS